MLEDVVFSRIDFVREARIHLHFIFSVSSHFFSVYLIIINIVCMIDPSQLISTLQ